MASLGLVVAAYHGPITEEMTEQARAAAADRDATVVDTVEVPGVYDTPLAADRLVRRDEIDAVAVLGAIVTGDTDHDQVIGRAAAEGLTRVSLERDAPVTFGVSGPGQTPEEAADRVHKGAEAVESAVDMVEALP
ncbi:MAG: 6,7-dimethyl-8-ribityllumazine synthase [Halobacteriales archaeon]